MSPLDGWRGTAGRSVLQKVPKATDAVWSMDNDLTKFCRQEARPSLLLSLPLPLPGLFTESLAGTGIAFDF